MVIVPTGVAPHDAARRGGRLERGLPVDLRMQTLVMHQAEGFRERGLAVSLSYAPTPSTPLGLTARAAPACGGQATSGAEALRGQETIAGMVSRPRY